MIAAPMMSAAEIMLWSAATGAVGVVVLMGLLDAALSRTKAAWQLLVYLLGFALAVILLGGLPDALWPAGRPWLQIAKCCSGRCALLSVPTASAGGFTPTGATR
jgi:hypothetical protein